MATSFCNWRLVAQITRTLTFSVDGRANRLKLSILQHLQQLRLQREIQFGDLIEKQRSTLGHLDASGLGPEGPGEGATLVSEEFALQQRARNGRAVHLDERPAAPHRMLMKVLANDLLAGAALAFDQDRNVGVRDFEQAAPNRGHCFGLPEDDRFGGNLIVASQVKI